MNSDQMDSKALEALFPDAARREILRVAFSDCNRWWSVADIAAEAGCPAETFLRPVRDLMAGGILREKCLGGFSVYRPDPDCPVFSELKGIITKMTLRSDRPATILVVEDQPATARITRILLESWNYTVLEAHSGPEAVEIFELHVNEVALVLTDVIMPGMSGTELAERLWRIQPRLRVVFMSGYPKDEKVPENAEFLPKPFNPDRLARVVRRELERV